MENQAAKSAIVTTRHTCLKIDGHALLSVNAGVPISLALETASNLLDSIDRINLNRANLGATAHANCLQHLTELTRVLVNASVDGLSVYERTLQ